MMISQSSSALQTFLWRCAREKKKNSKNSLKTRCCSQSAQIVAVLWQIFSAFEHVTITVCNGPLLVLLLQRPAEEEEEECLRSLLMCFLCLRSDGIVVVLLLSAQRQWTSSFQDEVLHCVCVCVFICPWRMPTGCSRIFCKKGIDTWWGAWWEHVFHEPLSLRIWITLDKSLYFLRHFGFQERPRRRRRRRADKDKNKKKTSAAFQEERGSEI